MNESLPTSDYALSETADKYLRLIAAQRHAANLICDSAHHWRWRKFGPKRACGRCHEAGVLVEYELRRLMRGYARELRDDGSDR